MKPCKNCDNLQEIPKGPGADRIKFKQPTIYDHMQTYAKFKNAKAVERELLACKAKVVGKNTKNTNLTIAPSQISEYYKVLNCHDSVQSDEGECGDVGGYSGKKSRESLINMSRSPIKCPAGTCNQTIGVTSLLSHFLRDHKQCFPVDFQDIDCNRRSVLIFDESIFPYGDTVCLGILAYGGKDQGDNFKPALNGICRPNSFLPDKYSHFQHHLPIVILGCKTSLSCALDDSDIAEQFYDPEDRQKDIILVWLATVGTTKRIHCTVTTFDQDLTSSRSTIIEVRNLKYSQVPGDFIGSDTNYLMLNRGDINILSKNSETPIQMEIFIHEFEQ